MPAHRSPARKPAPKPLPAPSDIDQVLPHLPPAPRCVVQLLQLTGARVGELLVLEQRDLIEIDNTTWAIPRQHKNTHRDHVRRVPLDARCLSILEHAGLRRPRLPLDPLFPSPRSPERPYTRDAIYGVSSDPDATARANIKKWHRIRGKQPDAIKDPYRRMDAVCRWTVLSRAVPPPCSHMVTAANVSARTWPPARSFAAGATGRSGFKEVAFQSTI